MLKCLVFDRKNQIYGNCCSGEQCGPWASLKKIFFLADSTVLVDVDSVLVLVHVSFIANVIMI